MRRALPTSLVLALLPALLLGCPSDPADRATDAQDSDDSDDSDAPGDTDPPDDTDDGGDPTAWQALLAGDGDTDPGGATTTRAWRLLARWTPGDGAEVPCDEDTETEVQECPSLIFRSDGRFVSTSEEGTLGYPGFHHTWTLDGDEITQTWSISAETYVETTRMEDLGLVSGRQQIRFHGVTSRDPGGSTYDTTGRSKLYELAP